MSDANFNQLNQELETIINDLQLNNLDIDQVIKKYQRGITLVDELEKQVKTAQNKITKLNPKNLKNKSKAK